MDALTEVLSPMAAYNPALLALTFLCIVVLIQSFLAGFIGLGKGGGEVAGMPLKGGHDDLCFRTLRTYANSTENLPAFGIIVFLAIIAGAAPGWVNWLAWIHVAARLIYWAIYYSGIGKVSGGARSMTYAAGWLANLILAGVALVALLG